MNCCKNIICAGTFNKCQDIILLPITAPISGPYSVHYQYAGGMLNGQSSFYNASEPIKFNNIIKKAGVYLISIYDIDGNNITINDCYKIELIDISTIKEPTNNQIVNIPPEIIDVVEVCVPQIDCNTVQQCCDKPINKCNCKNI